MIGKPKALSQSGIIHHLVMGVVIVGVALFGTFAFVLSHAATSSTGEVKSGWNGYCLDNKGDKAKNDNIVDLYKCNGTAAQNWQVNSNGTISLANGYCLGVNAPNGKLDLVKVPDPLVEIFGCRKTAASLKSSFQQWTVDGKSLMNNHGGMCVTDTASAPANGQLLRLYACPLTGAFNGDIWTLPGQGGTAPSPVKPSIPAGVKATANSAASVTVSWNASTDVGGPGVKGYDVLRNGSQVANVTGGALKYTDTSVAASTTYKYSVKAYDSASTPNVSAASVVVSVTTPKGTGGGGGGGTTTACTKPTWNTSDAEGTEAEGTGDIWWVSNDAWSGSHGPQTIYACSQSSWYAISTQPNNGGQVETYPDTEYDVNGRSGSHTKTIAQYKTITSTFSEAYPSGGSWDAAYDLWTDNWGHETMIWNEWAGSQAYWRTQAKTALTLDGVPYHFVANGSELIFLRDTQVKSGSVDILAAYNWEVANGYAKSTDVPTQLEYGVEVCATNGAETFPMNGLTFTLN